MSFRASLLPGLACLVSVGLCLLYGETRGQLSPWWRGHGGGVPYVLFWVLLWLTLIPRRAALIPICVGCVLITCGLECFQLVEGPPWLNEFRRTRFGAALLASGFDKFDFPPYFLGGLCGWVVGRMVLPKASATVAST